MNKLLSYGLILITGLSLTHPVAARDFCSLKTLQGTYIYALQGIFAGTPLAESGMESYDGKDMSSMFSRTARDKRLPVAQAPTL